MINCYQFLVKSLCSVGMQTAVSVLDWVLWFSTGREGSWTEMKVFQKMFCEILRWTAIWMFKKATGLGERGSLCISGWFSCTWELSGWVQVCPCLMRGDWQWASEGIKRCPQASLLTEKALSTGNETWQGETTDVENVWVLGTWNLVLSALPLTNNYGLLLCLEIEMIL